MRGLKILGLGGKLPRTKVNKEKQTGLSYNTNSGGRKKSGTSTMNSTTKTEMKCADGSCGTGTVGKPKRNKVEGKTPTIGKVPTPPETREKKPNSKLYANISGGGDGIPAFNVGEKIGKLLKVNVSPNSTDGGKSKTPDTVSSEQEEKGKGKPSSGFKVEFGISKNGVKKSIVELGKKK